MDVWPIRSREDHEAALREIDRLWGAAEGTEDGDKLDVMVTLVERYEEVGFPMPRTTPLGVLKFAMEESERSQVDLANLLGSRSRASEILSGKRDLTLEQIRLLQVEWRIPAGALIGALASDELATRPSKSALRRIQQRMAAFAPKTGSVADELIAERKPGVSRSPS